jgi:hypothetical protein
MAQEHLRLLAFLPFREPRREGLVERELALGDQKADREAREALGHALHVQRSRRVPERARDDDAVAGQDEQRIGVCPLALVDQGLERRAREARLLGRDARPRHLEVDQWNGGGVCLRDDGCRGGSRSACACGDGDGEDEREWAHADGLAR